MLLAYSLCRYFVVCKIGDSCQCILIDTQSSQGHLIPLDIPDLPWSAILIDFIVKLPVSSCFDSISVIVDQFSKATNFISGIKKLDASALTGLLISLFFCYHGLPDKIVSNCGPTFVLVFWLALHMALWIQLAPSTA